MEETNQGHKYKELFTFVVENNVGAQVTMYITLCPWYGYAPLKLGDTYDTIMGYAMDFYPNNLPTDFKFTVNAKENNVILFEKNKEIWYKLDGEEGLALDAWQTRFLKTIERNNYGS